ncbi:MAG: hypothetical protein N3B13_00150 [Deltaproteobacteria bacterium]|nr:hypothetical protein [Deltaproteobacteria bacterium]
MLRVKNEVLNYYGQFEIYSGELREKSLRYYNEFKKYLDKVASVECSPYAGGEGYYCRKYRTLLEEKHFEKVWDEIELKYKSAIESVNEKRDLLKNYIPNPNVSKLSSNVDNLNLLSESLIGDIESASIKIVEIFTEVLEQFSVERLVVRDEVKRKTELPAQKSPEISRFALLDIKKKSNLFIKKNLSFNAGEILLAFRENLIIPVILTIFLAFLYYPLHILFFKEFSNNLRIYKDEIINKVPYESLIKIRERGFERWNNYLSTFPPFYSDYIKFTPSDGDMFEILRRLLSDLLTLNFGDENINNTLKIAIKFSRNKIEILSGLRDVLISSDFQKKLYPSLSRYDIVDLSRVLRKRLKENLKERIKLKITEDEFRKAFSAQSANDNDMIQIKVISRVFDDVVYGLNVVREVLKNSIEDITYIQIFDVRSGILLINLWFLKLIRYEGLYRQIFSFEESQNNLASAINVIEEKLSAMQKSNYVLEELLEIESKLNVFSDIDNLKPELKFWVYKEIARQYAHRGDSENAFDYLKKINVLRNEIDGKRLFNTDIEEYMVEAKLLHSHLLADMLDYNKAIEEIDRLIEKYESRENSSLYKAYSAKGHILSISGEADKAVSILKKAYLRLELSSRMQSGITLLRALINTGNRNNFGLAEKYAEEIENDMAKYREDIDEYRQNRRFLAFEKCRYYYSRCLTDKRFCKKGQRLIDETINEWSGVDVVKPLTFSNMSYDINPAVYYPEVLSLHMKIMVDLRNELYADFADKFYENLSVFVKGRLIKPDIITALFLLAISEWLYFYDSREKILAIFGEIKTEGLKSRNTLLGVYVADIISLIKSQMQAPNREVFRDNIIVLKKRAEYIPGVLPKI